MTSDDYMRLADYFADAPDSHASVAINVPEQRALVVSALRAASVKAGEVVAVKPLEWEKITWERYPKFKAVTPTGDYWVWELAGIGYWSQHSLIGREVHGTIDDAKAAAQSDYEARIRSALVVEPAAPTASVGAMREALEQALERMKMAVDWWNKGGHSLPQMSAAIEMAESALGAANQSDGGVEGHAAMGRWGATESDAPRAGIKPGPSDTAPAEPVATKAFIEAFGKSLDDDFGFWSSPTSDAVRSKLYGLWAKANAEVLIPLHPPRSVDVEAIERAVVAWADGEEIELTIRQVHALARSTAAMIEGE
jgi:hypothetical protein